MVTASGTPSPSMSYAGEESTACTFVAVRGPFIKGMMIPTV
jgi:hypothetical protein